MKKATFGFLIALFVVGVTLVAASCNGGNQAKPAVTSPTEQVSKEKDHDDNEDKHDDDEDKHDSSGKDVKSTDFASQKNSQTAGVIDAYEQINKALEANDKTKAVEGAKAMLAAFEKFDATKLNGKQKKEYDEIVESANEQSEHIVKSDLSHQKEHFEQLTTDIKDFVTLVADKSKE